MLTEAVTRLDAAGLQPHFHAIGDRAVRESLDAVAAARAANGPSDTRPHIAHIQVIHPDDVPRFAALDVVGQRPAATGPATRPRWTSSRSRSSGRSGRRGSTRSPRCCAPGHGWRWAPTGASPPRTRCSRWRSRSTGSGPSRAARSEPLLPSERLTLAEAIHGFTLGSAWVNHLDDVTGSIETGKLADLAIIDRDLFAPDAGPIGDAKVVLTTIGGEIVFEDPAIG